MSDTIASGYQLVRIEGSVYVSNFINLGNGNYKISDFDLGLPYKISVSDAFLSFSFDKQTKEITFSSGVVPSSSSPLIVFYYLFFTGEHKRYEFINPLDSLTDRVLWDNLLSKYVTTGQTIKNARHGLLTKKNISISLINKFKIQNHISTKHSFSGKEIKIWENFNNTKTLIYTGSIKSLSFNKEVVTFTTTHSDSKFKEPATFGNNLFHSGVLHKDDVSKIKTRFLGKYHYFPFKQISGIFQTSAYAHSANEYKYRAVCENYNSRKFSTQNRVWKAGIISNNLLMQNINGKTISRTIKDPYYSTFSFEHIFFQVNGMLNVELGATVKWSNSGKTYYATVMRNKPFLHAGLLYNLAVYSEGSSNFGVIDASTSSSFINLPNFGVVILAKNKQPAVHKFNVPYADSCVNALQGLHYTLSQTVVNNGIELTINFKNSLPSYSVLNENNQVNTLENVLNIDEGGNLKPIFLNPDDYEVYPVIYQEFNSKHNSIIENISTELFGGARLDGASFFQAGVDLDTRFCFTIPELDNNKLESYEFYMQKMMQDIGSVLYFDENGFLHYNIIKSKATNEVRTNLEILESSLELSIDYTNIKNDILFTNRHLDYPAIDVPILFSTSNIVSKKLYGSKKVFNKDTYIINPSSATINRVINLLKDRILNISYSTAFLDRNNNVSDNVNINNETINQNGMITNISRSMQKTNITLDDLGDL